MNENDAPQTSSPENDSASTAARKRFARKWIGAVGTLEGISFLLLLFVAMPLKYIGQNPAMVHWLGPLHGGLFLLYVASAVAVARPLNWSWKQLVTALIASVVPAGPFAFEAYLRGLPENTAR